jgi:N-ethylmaleimide reductase
MSLTILERERPDKKSSHHIPELKNPIVKMKTMKSLLETYQLGPITLRNRIIMAPLTRSRAGEGEAPRELNAEYYRQRASAGLIVSEATQVSRQGQGYLWTPGIFTEQQVAGWRKVTEAVHAANGRMFLQMWHVGRISHTTLQPEGEVPVSSTEEAAEHSFSFALDHQGRPANLPVSKPRMAGKEDLQRILGDFERGAHNVKKAGFDGAEIHGANGYLFDQFLNSVVNERSDEYGNQTKESRTRLLLEAFDVVAGVLGAGRVGVRISPYGSFNGMNPDPKAEETFLYLAAELEKRGCIYIHIVRGSQLDAEPAVSEDFFRKIRKAFGRTIIITGGLNKAVAEQLLASELADLFGFGTLFISNPDLPERLKNNWPLATPDQHTLYGGDAKGYTDYPAYQGDLVTR